MVKPKKSLLDPALLKAAVFDSFRKLDLRVQWHNPVMFVTELGAIACTLVVLRDAFTGHLSGFNLQITLWLWFTVLFANFAEALAEGRGKAQADSLRKARKDTIARRLCDGGEERVPAPELKKGDAVVCEAGDVIPADGEVIEGIASVDEAAITGESAPVIRESGGDRSAVMGGTRVISDRIVIRVTSEKGNAFLDRMIAMVEGAKRQRTPNEVALGLLLTGMTVVFLLAVTLAANAFRVLAATTGQEGLVLAAQHRPAVVILDLGLPDLSGQEVLRRLREWSNVPVVILSVQDDEAGKVSALDAGADDYVTKPFNTSELLARLRWACSCLSRVTSLPRPTKGSAGVGRIDAVFVCMTRYHDINCLLGRSHPP